MITFEYFQPLNMIKKLLFFVLLIFIRSLFAQENTTEFYDRLAKGYENLAKNDEKAFHYLNQMITKAKEDKDYQQLANAYSHAVYYTKNKKFDYADSAIWASHLSKNSYVIANSYTLKGSVYYFDYRFYQKALDEYLKAYEYGKNVADSYLQYKIKYHIATVKSYLGLPEAGILLEECANYFQSIINTPDHPNHIYNHRKGYLNSLHQLTILNENAGNHHKVDSLVAIGLESTPSSHDFDLERSYFYKCHGIAAFHKKNYEEADEFLNKALPQIQKSNDFTWEAAVFYYLGKSALAQNQENKALLYLEKVDALFVQNQFLLPETRNVYELFIDHYRHKNEKDPQLYFTNQLLKLDSIHAVDFRNLTPRIHKKYDTEELVRQKKLLEEDQVRFKNWMGLMAVMVLILLIGLVYYFSKQKKLNKSHNELTLQLNNQTVDSLARPKGVENKKSANALDEKIVQNLLQQLNAFENKQGFTKKGLSLQQLATQLKTNRAYLSQVINEFKGGNFSQYLNKLRIDYITKKLYHDQNYLKYSTDHLADEAGYSSRQQFSEAFNEINGIRPSAFQKKRKASLEKGV